MEFGKVIKSFKSKKGNEVEVRYPRWEDLDSMHQYINELSQEDTYLSVLGKTYTLEEERKFLQMTMKNMDAGLTRHYAIFINGAYAGNCEIERAKEQRQQHVGVLGVSLRKNYRDEGIGTELMRMLIEEGKKMGLRLLTLNCFECNPRALHIYEKLGFKRVGVVPGAIAYKGDFCGEVKFYLPLV